MKLKAKTDLHKNVLYLSYAGVVSKSSMNSLYTDVRFSVSALKPGFDVIADFTDCSLIKLDSIPILKKIMNYLIQAGLGEIVRILQSDKISHKQMLNLASHVQGYKPIYVDTLDKAEAELTKSAKRAGLRIHLHDLPATYTFIKGEEEGSILNISTSGCAIKSAATLLEVGEEIVLKFSLAENKESDKYFEIKADVVRVADDHFAAVFSELSKEEQDKIWKCLITEVNS